MLVTCSVCKKEFSSLEKWKEYSSSCPKSGGEFKCASDSDVPTLFKFKSNQLQSSYQIIGAPSSGKSYYLYTLLNILFESPPDELLSYFEKLNITIDPIHGYSQGRIQDIRNKTLRGEASLGTLPEAFENYMPLVFTFSRGYGMPKVHISFFDLSGEHFRDTKSERFLNDDPRIKYAKGIIVLIDPFQDSNLAQMANHQYNFADTARNLVNTLQEAIRYRDDRRSPNKVPIPVAFCISMFDVLEEKIPYAITQNPYLELEHLFTKDYFINENEIDQNSAFIENFLETQGKEMKRQVQTIRQRYQSYKWFAISSIGHEEVHIRQKGLNPKGILAPIFWLMSFNGELPVKKSRNYF